MSNLANIVGWFANSTTEGASNLAGTAHKVATDTGTTVAKITYDTAGTAVKVMGDSISIPRKVVVDLAGTSAKVGSDVAGTAIKIANDTGGTVNLIRQGKVAGVPSKMLYDALGTGSKVVTDVAGTSVKVIGDGVGTVAKVGSDLTSTASEVKNDTLSTSEKIVLDTETTVDKVRDDILPTVARAVSHKLSSRAADVYIKVALDIFTAGSDVAVVDAILQLTRCSLEALTRSLSGAMLIWRGIFTNGTNEASLLFILNHLYDLLQFLYDLVKPGNVITIFPAADGEIENNPYNELDLRREENRHAVIYQVQRVSLTVMTTLKIGREYGPSSRLDDLQINESLRSDFDRDGNPPPPTYISRLEGDLTWPPDEKWLFVNGIANELVWFQRSCDKIRDTFKREVKGILNRSDGILWDLIECCGEHSAVRSNTLIECTQSSKAAQETLERELRDALWPPGADRPAKVVMIAHSQGCLLLRLVLQRLVTDEQNGPQQRRDMKERLRVFTFGNPSIDWRVADGLEQSLSEYARATEHFAHKLDFVARLGVVTHRDDQDSGFDSKSVFYSKGGRGHLFGAHYPLAAAAYRNGAKSTLLRAVGGKQMA